MLPDHIKQEKEDARLNLACFLNRALKLHEARIQAGLLNPTPLIDKQGIAELDTAFTDALETVIPYFPQAFEAAGLEMPGELADNDEKIERYIKVVDALIDAETSQDERDLMESLGG